LAFAAGIRLHTHHVHPGVAGLLHSKEKKPPARSTLEAATSPTLSPVPLNYSHQGGLVKAWR